VVGRRSQGCPWRVQGGISAFGRLGYACREGQRKLVLVDCDDEMGVGKEEKGTEKMAVLVGQLSRRGGKKGTLTEGL
jgi:hypothetical protein